MRLCAICGDSVPAGGAGVVILADDTLICADCHKYSAIVRECESCEREFHAANLYKTEDGIYCEECIQEQVKEMDFMAWDEWLTACEEDEEPENATVKSWLSWHEEAWEETPEIDPLKIVMRKMLAEEMKKAV